MKRETFIIIYHIWLIETLVGLHSTHGDTAFLYINMLVLSILILIRRWYIVKNGHVPALKEPWWKGGMWNMRWVDCKNDFFAIFHRP